MGGRAQTAFAHRGPLQVTRWNYNDLHFLSQRAGDVVVMVSRDNVRTHPLHEQPSWCYVLLPVSESVSVVPPNIHLHRSLT